MREVLDSSFGIHANEKANFFYVVIVGPIGFLISLTHLAQRASLTYIGLLRAYPSEYP